MSSAQYERIRRLMQTDRKRHWIKGLVMRCNKNIATVALANKNARSIRALLARGASYQPA